MNIVELLIIIFGILSVIGGLLLLGLLLYQANNRITEVNKQLMIIVAGKEAKPEALRALVASNKPPQGKLKGIAMGKDKKKSPVNTDYTLVVGENNEL